MLVTCISDACVETFVLGDLCSQNLVLFSQKNGLVGAYDEVAIVFSSKLMKLKLVSLVKEQSVAERYRTALSCKLNDQIETFESQNDAFGVLVSLVPQYMRLKLGFR